MEEHLCLLLFLGMKKIAILPKSFRVFPPRSLEGKFARQPRRPDYVLRKYSNSSAPSGEGRSAACAAQARRWRRTPPCARVEATRVPAAVCLVATCARLHRAVITPTPVIAPLGYSAAS